MSFSNWFTVAALALLPLAATAQQTQQQPNPADANASVPASGYVSAFKDYRAAADEKASPDKVWRAANEQVKNPDEHAGHMNSGTGNAASAPKADASQRSPGQRGQADSHAGRSSKGK